MKCLILENLRGVKVDSRVINKIVSYNEGHELVMNWLVDNGLFESTKIAYLRYAADIMLTFSEEKHYTLWAMSHPKEITEYKIMDKLLKDVTP